VKHSSPPELAKDNAPPREMLVGELSRRAGIPPHTIRYYERRCLLKAPKRSAARYRLYSREDEERLHFINVAKSLGLRLDEIAELIRMGNAGNAPCERLRDFIEGHIADVERQIAVLHQLRASLNERLGAITDGSHARGARAQICPILESDDRREGHDRPVFRHTKRR